MTKPLLASLNKVIGAWKPLLAKYGRAENDQVHLSAALPRAG